MTMTAEDHCMNLVSSCRGRVRAVEIAMVSTVWLTCCLDVLGVYPWRGERAAGVALVCDRSKRTLMVSRCRRAGPRGAPDQTLYHGGRPVTGASRDGCITSTSPTRPLPTHPGSRFFSSEPAGRGGPNVAQREPEIQRYPPGVEEPLEVAGGHSSSPDAS